MFLGSAGPNGSWAARASQGTSKLCHAETARVEPRASRRSAALRDACAGKCFGTAPPGGLRAPWPSGNASAAGLVPSLHAEKLMGKLRDATSPAAGARGRGEAGGIAPIVPTGRSLCLGGGPCSGRSEWSGPRVRGCGARVRGCLAGHPHERHRGDTGARLGRCRLSRGSTPLLFLLMGKCLQLGRIPN